MNNYESVVKDAIQSMPEFKQKKILDKDAFDYLMKGLEGGRAYCHMVRSLRGMGYVTSAGNQLSDSNISAFMIKNGIRQIKYRGKRPQAFTAKIVAKPVGILPPKTSPTGSHYQQTLMNMQHILSMNIDDKTRVRLITALLLPEA